MLTVKEFRSNHDGGFYIYADEDIPGFYKKGDTVYGDVDDMIVVMWIYQPLNGIYTLRVKKGGQEHE